MARHIVKKSTRKASPICKLREVTDQPVPSSVNKATTAPFSSLTPSNNYPVVLPAGPAISSAVYLPTITVDDVMFLQKFLRRRSNYKRSMM